MLREPTSPGRATTYLVGLVFFVLGVFGEDLVRAVYQKLGINPASWAGPLLTLFGHPGFIFSTGLLAGGLIGLRLHVWRQETKSRIEVFKDFKAAYLQYASPAGIGEAVDEPVRGSLAVWNEYENAACLWFRRTHRLYCLPFVSGRTVFYVQDPGTLGFENPERNGQLLQLEAHIGLRDRESWSWIQGFKWELKVRDDDLIVQAFQYGFMAGYFPRDPERPIKRIVWVVDGKTWSDYAIEDNPCPAAEPSKSNWSFIRRYLIAPTSGAK